jgi:hypothetical protein
MQNNECYSELEQHVLKTLLYYDIFNYPLKSDEVFYFSGANGFTKNDVAATLNVLINKKCVFQFGDFYSINSNETNIERRVKGNKEAEKYLIIAQRQAKLISGFPFVRSVMASGSLSKGYMDENSDLDFFVVTQPGKLWIARTLLVLYKRIFLANSHKYFCVNYFVDSHHLEIEEKNLFTATELATVIPLYNANEYYQLHLKNNWIKRYFPNYISRPTDNVPQVQNNSIKNILEKVLSPFASVTEKFLMQLTLRRWKRKHQAGYSEADFKIAFKTKKHASKNHPKHYQRKIMDLYQQKLEAFFNKNHIVLR